MLLSSDVDSSTKTHEARVKLQEEAMRRDGVVPTETSGRNNNCFYSCLIRFAQLEGLVRPASVKRLTATEIRYNSELLVGQIVFPFSLFHLCALHCVCCLVL